LISFYKSLDLNFLYYFDLFILFSFLLIINIKDINKIFDFNYITILFYFFIFSLSGMLLFVFENSSHFIETNLLTILFFIIMFFIRAKK